MSAPKSVRCFISGRFGGVFFFFGDANEPITRQWLGHTAQGGGLVHPATCPRDGLCPPKSTFPGLPDPRSSAWGCRWPRPGREAPPPLPLRWRSARCSWPPSAAACWPGYAPSTPSPPPPSVPDSCGLRLLDCAHFPASGFFCDAWTIV